MVTQMQPRPPAQTVLVEDASVYISDFVESDPDVVRVLGEAEDPEATTHTLLQIGALATMRASLSMDARVVEHRFDRMAEGFDSKVEQAVASITGTAKHLLDEDEGALPKALAEVKENVTAILGETFDEDSRSSVIAKIDAVMVQATERLDAKVRAALDPDTTASPLGRVKKDMADLVKDQIASVMKELRDVSLSLAANQARAEVMDRTTAKGFDFEDLVDEGLAAIASIYGDLSENVGRFVGGAGTRKGDHLVTLNRDDTCGQEGAFVLESKDQALTMAKTLAELDKALQNHSAQAAIAVFSGQGLAPTKVPFHWSGNRAVAVFDKEDPDPRVLQLAYAWARWVVRRSLTAQDEDAIDLGRVESVLSSARRALARHQTIKACHSTARKKIDESAAQVADLVDEVDHALVAVWDELNR